MKTFSIRNVLAVLVVGVLLGTAYFTNSGLLKVRKAEAVAVPLAGYAWGLGAGGASDPAAGPYTAGSNPGIGWISFSSTNETGGQTYGVNITQVLSIGTAGIGVLSGQAWAPNDPDSNLNPTGIGWISFDRSVAGSPNSAWGDPGLLQTGTPLAYVDWATGSVYGWARAIVACKDNNWNGTSCINAPAAGDKAGGWDGWIKLSGTWTGGVAVAADGSFSGKAWGGDVIGWIDFAPMSGVDAAKNVHLSAPIACNASNPSTYISQCVPIGQCVGTSPQNVPATQIGTCLDGSGTVPIVPNTCTTVSQVCTPAPAPSTPSTTKTHFWQF